MRYYARVGALFTVISAAALVACGSDSNHADDTLPPIISTTTTTTLPPTTTTIPDTYVIQSGDSLFSIAQMFGISTSELAVYNGITNPDHIQAGQKLKIPQPGETTTTIVPIIDPSSTLDPTATTVAP